MAQLELTTYPEPLPYQKQESALGGLALAGETALSASRYGFIKNKCGPIVARALDRLYSNEYFGDFAFSKLHRYGMHAIENDLLHGTAALCVLENSTKEGFFSPYEDRWLDKTEKARQYSPTFLFHGTYLDPDSMRTGIEPRSCVQTQAPGTFTTAAPCSSHSYGSAYFPKIRSLLHQDSPHLRGIDSPVLFRRKNIHGLAFTFTHKKVIERLLDQDATGWVYVSPADPEQFMPAESYEDQQEVRLYQPIKCNYAIRTSMQDLPNDLVVLDGSIDALWGFMDKFKQEASWKSVADKLGLESYWLGDVLDGLHNCSHGRICTETVRDRKRVSNKGTLTIIEYLRWPFYKNQIKPS